MNQPTVRRARRPWTRSSYDNRVHGASNDGVPDTSIFFNQAQRIKLVRAKLSDGPLCIRPWPALNPDDPSQILETRKAGDKGLKLRGLTEWYCRCEIAKYIGTGNQKCSWVLRDPDNHEQALQQNPYWLLYYNALNHYKAWEDRKGATWWDPNWNRLLTKNMSGFSKPDATIFIQGEVYCNGKEDYFAKRQSALGSQDGDELVVTQLAKSAGENLVKLMDITLRGVAAEEEDWRKVFMHDVIGQYDPSTGGIRGGRYLVFFDPATTSADPFKNVNGESSWNGEPPKEWAEHHVWIRKTYPFTRAPFAADMTPQAVTNAMNKWVPWYVPGDPDQALLRVMSYEEQAVLLARLLASEGQLLERMWADHPQYLTEEVLRVLHAARSVAMPGTNEDPGLPSRHSSQQVRPEYEPRSVQPEHVQAEAPPFQPAVGGGSYEEQALPPHRGVAAGSGAAQAAPFEVTSEEPSLAPPEITSEVEPPLTNGEPPQSAILGHGSASATAAAPQPLERPLDDAAFFGRSSPLSHSEVAGAAKFAAANTPTPATATVTPAEGSALGVPTAAEVAAAQAEARKRSAGRGAAAARR